MNIIINIDSILHAAIVITDPLWSLCKLNLNGTWSSLSSVNREVQLQLLSQRHIVPPIPLVVVCNVGVIQCAAHICSKRELYKNVHRNI